MLQDVYVGQRVYQPADYQPSTPGPIRQYLFSKFTSATYGFSAQDTASSTPSSITSNNTNTNTTSAAVSSRSSAARPQMLRTASAPAGALNRLSGAHPNGSGVNSGASSRAQSPSGLSREV